MLTFQYRPHIALVTSCIRKEVFDKIVKVFEGSTEGKGEAVEGGEKPKFAKLLPSQSIETIGLEEGLELFNLPREIGNHENELVKVSIGKYGPYALYKNKFYSLGKNANVFDDALFIGRVQVNMNDGKKRRFLYFTADYQSKK